MQVVSQAEGTDTTAPSTASPPLRRAPTVLDMLASTPDAEGPAHPYLVERALSSRFRSNPIAMQDLFASWDTDNSGFIDLDEVSARAQACASVRKRAQACASVRKRPNPIRREMV